jgi:hypothetical protein
MYLGVVYAGIGIAGIHKKTSSEQRAECECGVFVFELHTERRGGRCIPRALFCFAFTNQTALVLKGAVGL